MPLKVIISGGPGSGKGTQAERIVAEWGLVHLSTGDILRQEIKNDSELGRKAKEFMNKGELVPDSVICELVKHRIQQKDCQEKGWLLDGFPRTAEQAHYLNKNHITPTHFIHLDVADDVIVERISGRVSDPESGKIYHLKFNPPPKGMKIFQREDDTEGKVRVRLQIFHKNYKEISKIYEKLHVLIDGNRDASLVYRDVATRLHGSLL
eukprot:TRINITY_DN611_c0_g1_i1.p1 TRINITY_DN611_c0_g1~~TRINITY_DN611_c0_g1_i1.p1  ORF type:complete len:208 (+),score=40.82 TRINITY_DN611_c0_g1_i1:89-712(+)